jgi:hypothetical protein
VKSTSSRLSDDAKVVNHTYAVTFCALFAHNDKCLNGFAAAPSRTRSRTRRTSFWISNVVSRLITCLPHRSYSQGEGFAGHPHITLFARVVQSEFSRFPLAIDSNCNCCSLGGFGSKGKVPNDYQACFLMPIFIGHRGGITILEERFVVRQDAFKRRRNSDPWT